MSRFGPAIPERQSPAFVECTSVTVRQATITDAGQTATRVGYFLRLLVLVALARSAAEAGGQAVSTLQKAPAIGPLARQPFVRMTGDIRGYELVPSFNGSFKGAPFHTNRWGMRDKEYSLKAPSGTYRIALLGSSFSMGAGVPESETHEALLEDRLNREGPGVPRRHYEILNFSVGGYGILHNVVVLDQKVLPFAPNAVLLVMHSIEPSRLVKQLSQLVQAGIPIEYPYLQQKLQQAGVKQGMEEPELLRRIAPLRRELLTWSYQHVAQLCRQRGIALVGVAFPQPREGDSERLAQVAELAAAAGIPVLSLEGAYDGYPLDSVWLGVIRTTVDIHLNALGHRLIANRLYDVLRQNDARALRLGFAAR